MTSDRAHHDHRCDFMKFIWKVAVYGADRERDFYCYDMLSHLLNHLSNLAGKGKYLSTVCSVDGADMLTPS
jgi:hypothetical protein